MKNNTYQLMPLIILCLSISTTEASPLYSKIYTLYHPDTNTYVCRNKQLEITAGINPDDTSCQWNIIYMKSMNSNKKYHLKILAQESNTMSLGVQMSPVSSKRLKIINGDPYPTEANEWIFHEDPVIRSQEVGQLTLNGYSSHGLYHYTLSRKLPAMVDAPFLAFKDSEIEMLEIPPANLLFEIRGV